MKRLAISLLLVVLAATLGAGCALDESARGVTVYYALAGRDDVLAVGHPEPRTAPTPRRLLTLGFDVALLLVGLWLLPLIRRLEWLARASEAFGRGDPEARVPTRPGSDLHAVESAFNAMAARIGRLIDYNRLLARGVAHDLKTPFARLRFGIDFLEELDASANDPERRDVRRPSGYLVRARGRAPGGSGGRAPAGHARGQPAAERVRARPRTRVRDDRR